MIHLQDLRKTYDRTVAIHNLSLEVGKGHTLGLIGPNGSGKTTLLRMICTLAKPDQGSIRVNNIDAVNSPRDVRRCLAFMPAEFGFPRQMTIGEYMDYFACLAGVPFKERPNTISQVLELTDLLGRESEGVRGLSTGNRQRLLLAKTLLGDPELLILDEPASGLDPRARTEVRLILRELSAMGKTIIISSHILADIQDICSHICILEAGNMVLSGNLKELLSTKNRTERVVRLEVNEADRERARAHLLEMEEVQSCEYEGHLLEVASLEQNCNFLLTALIAQDIEILGMAEETMNLEDIFLRSTQGKVT